MKKLILIISILVGLTSFKTTFGQDSNMAVFKDMVGKWKGNAVSQTPEGKMEISQSEDINYELDGKILVIRGTGRVPQSDSVIFRAFGVIHFDAPSKEYKFSAYTMDGNYVLADATYEANVLTWSFDVPNGGRVEYTLKFDDKTWVEDGKYSPDGQQWYPFFHMELEKVKQ